MTADRTSVENDAWLAEVEQRCEAATPGPWHLDSLPTIRDENDALLATTWHGMTGNARPNAEFMAHAREDLPELLALVRELQAENKRLQTKLEKAVAQDYCTFCGKELDGYEG